MRDVRLLALAALLLTAAVAGCAPQGCDTTTGVQDCSAVAGGCCAAARRLCEAYVYDPDYRPYY